MIGNMRTVLEDSTWNDESESSEPRVDFTFCFFDRALSLLFKSLIWKSNSQKWILEGGEKGRNN